MRVFRIDVKLADMDEDVEDQTGLYLRLNDDDDDSDTEIDNQDNKVIGEDDLVRLEISCEPGDLSGNFTLSWGNNIKLWERTEKETEITQSQYTSEQLPKTCYVEGYNVSKTIKDAEIKLSYQAPDGVTAMDTVIATVVQLTVEADSEAICAGGDDLGVCRTDVTATIHPAMAGKTINFSISGDKGVDTSRGIIYYDVGSSRGSLNSTTATTNSSGQATVQLTSGADASNPDTYLYFSVAVKASLENVDSDTTWVEYDLPNEELQIFINPETGEPLEYLEADGKSQVLNKLIVSYHSQGIPGHSITWTFRFWDKTTLDSAAGGDFESLSDAQKEAIFATTNPDYEGNGPSDYGELTPLTSITDSSGMATAIYTAGTKVGYIEFQTADSNINPAKRGSWQWLGKLVRKKGKPRERTNLVVYMGEMPEGVSPPMDMINIKYYLRNCFNFLPDSRFVYAGTKFTTCRENEFNVLNTDRFGFAPGEMGVSFGNAQCFIHYMNIIHNYSTGLDERAGRTAAHEMGHSIASHHGTCVMVSNVTDLPTNCQHFCGICIGKWWALLGGQ